MALGRKPQVTAALTRLHFAPTARARRNLLRDGVDPSAIEVIGNTVIDALLAVHDRLETDLVLRRTIAANFPMLRDEASLVLITGHRRENFGRGFDRICTAISELADEFPDTDFVYPVHLNPNVRQPVERLLGEVERPPH